MKPCPIRALLVQWLAIVLLALTNPPDLHAVTVTMTPPSVTFGWAGTTFSGTLEITGHDYYNYSYSTSASVSGAGSSGANVSMNLGWGGSYSVSTDVAGRGDVTVTITVTGTPLPWSTEPGNDDASASTGVTIGDIDSISPATEYALKGTTLTFSATANPGACTLPNPVWETTGGGTITGAGLSGTFVADASIRGLANLKISAGGATAQTATVEEIDVTNVTVPGETIEGTMDGTFTVVPLPEPAGLTYDWSYGLEPAAGNGGPSIVFTAPGNKSTGLSLKAHWFALPDDPADAPLTCTYRISCKVSYKGGFDDITEKPWNVKIADPPGFTPIPSIVGNPIYVDNYDPILKITTWSLAGIGSLGPSSVSGAGVPTDSDFFAKVIVHGVTRLARYHTLINPMIVAMYNGMSGATAPNLVTLKAIVDTHRNIASVYVQAACEAAAEIVNQGAHLFSDPIGPHYLLNKVY